MLLVYRFWKCGNVDAAGRIGIGDHGGVHIQLVAKDADGLDSMFNHYPPASEFRIQTCVASSAVSQGHA